MSKPRIFVKLFLSTALIICVLTASSVAGYQSGSARQSNSQELYDSAKRLYEDGAYRKALDVVGDLLKSNPDNAPALFLKYRALFGLFVNAPRPSFDEVTSPDALRERKIQLATLLKEAAESLERFLRLKPDAKDADLLEGQLSALRVYAEPAVKPESEWTIFSPSEVTQKAHILRRPQPRYPEEARVAGDSGGVKLLVVLAADGTVKNILVLKAASSLLTRASIEAASKIKSEPAIKDGHPVATTVLVEYHFQTY